MPWYARIRDDTPEGRRTLERLIELRRALDRQVPRRSDDQLLLATWNIREFDSTAYGARTNEPLQYIAEIVARFDIIAITEVRSDLKALNRLMGILGRDWRYIVTDTTAGRAGNAERMAVVYDSTNVEFGGLAGELVLPPIITKGEDGKSIEVPAAQFARTPLLAGFRAKWIDFQLAVFHVIWGEGEEPRREEVRQLTAALTQKASDPITWSRNLIVLGDFNIGSPTDAAWDGLKAEGWVIPKDFAEDIRGTNVAQDKFYDQIAIRPREHFFELARFPDRPSAGAFNYFDVVYRPVADFETYRPEMEAFEPNRATSNFFRDSKGVARTPDQQRAWYREYWRTYQMSDHLPLWISLRTDNADAYLQDRLENPRSTRARRVR